MLSLNSLNSVTKKLKSKRKIAGLEPRISCVSDLPLSHRATSTRADPYSEPNSCLSDFSDSLNSLNSMKVLLHLEKTPLNLSSRPKPISFDYFFHSCSRNTLDNATVNLMASAIFIVPFVTV